MTNWTRMALAYDGPLPGYTPRAPVPSDIQHLSTDALRRHAGHALSVNRFDASIDYQAEIARREREAA